MTLPTCSMCGVVALDGIADDTLDADGLCTDCASYLRPPERNAEGERLLSVDPVFGPIYETATARVYREAADRLRAMSNPREYDEPTIVECPRCGGPTETTRELTCADGHPREVMVPRRTTVS